MTQTLSPERDAPERPRVHVLTDRCAGCQECAIRCPTGALSMDAARWVVDANSDLCTGCRQCERTCPFSAIVVEGPALAGVRLDPAPVHPAELVGDVSEIRPGLAGWSAVLAEAERCLQCPDPTCVRGCPTHNDIPGFIAELRQRNVEGAREILRRTSMLSDVCSRVCNQSAQCEGACSWSLAGEAPVAIGRLERFVTDQLSIEPPRVRERATGLSIGIVGAGPAGAGAAWDLVEAGASVTVYERDATPGGLCAWGIPDFTLGESIAVRPWHQLADAGVELRCGTEILSGDLDELLARHDAVIMAHGASVPLRLNVPGADLDGVFDATFFLKGAHDALAPGGDREALLTRLGLAARGTARAAHVLVVGAGNTAMDVARTARRLGLDATCIDWLDERWALARPDELEEARHEGVEVRFLRTITALHDSHGRVAHAELARTAQPSPDQRPDVLKAEPERLEVDLVVMAMGYRNDPEWAGALPGTPLSRHGSVVPDRRWTASGIFAGAVPGALASVGELALQREARLAASALPVNPRLWVAGDALTGPATVVEAMAQGRRAAAAVLDGQPARPESGASRSPDSMRVLVCYESVGGTTARAAAAIADGFATRGVVARVLPIAKVDTAELASADLVVLGTWVEGFVVAGVGPAKATRAWLERLPRLGGVQVAVFCTFGVAPKATLPLLRRAFEERGAVVVGQAAFGRKELAATASVFGPAAFGEKLAREVVTKEKMSVRVV